MLSVCIKSLVTSGGKHSEEISIDFIRPTTAYYPKLYRILQFLHMVEFVVVLWRPSCRPPREMADLRAQATNKPTIIPVNQFHNYNRISFEIEATSIFKVPKDFPDFIIRSN